MSETSAEYIRNARRALADAAQWLREAEDGGPDSRQCWAITAGLRMVGQARDVLVPAAVIR